MKAQPLKLAVDRAIRVPPGHKVVTGRVSVWQIQHACRDRMAPESVVSAFRKRIQLGGGDSFPPPWGEWEDNMRSTFIVYDGRHEHLSAIMAGDAELLVAWLEEAP